MQSIILLFVLDSLYDNQAYYWLEMFYVRLKETFCVRPLRSSGRAQRRGLMPLLSPADRPVVAGRSAGKREGGASSYREITLRETSSSHEITHGKHTLRHYLVWLHDAL